MYMRRKIFKFLILPYETSTGVGNRLYRAPS